MEPLHLKHILQTVGALEAVVLRSFGPHGGQVLFTRDTGQAMLSRSGTRILTALRLDNPLARMIVECASVHSAKTGDGSKTFIVLLASLVRMIDTAASKEPHVSHSYSSGEEARSATARRLADELLSFALQELDDLITVGVVSYGYRLLWQDFNTASQSPAQKLLSSFFNTRLGHNHCDFISGLLCEMLTNWMSNDNKPFSTLHFLNDMLPALYTPVVGFPIGYSRLINGQVIHRDFAMPFTLPTQKSIKAIALNEPLIPKFIDGEVLEVGSTGSILQFSSFAEFSLESVIVYLQSLGVSVLLSSVKQSKAVLSLAAQRQINVVECISQDELSLFSHLSGAMPVSTFRRIQSAHVVSLAFCKPILLGAHRYVHVGFLEKENIKPCSLVICGAGEGQTEQCASALQDAIRMLLTTWEPPTSESEYCFFKCNIKGSPCATTSALCGQNFAQGYVIAAGGAFEFLLSHVLNQSAVSREKKTVSNILVHSLLCVPHQIYSHNPRHFLQTQSKVLKYIQEHRTNPTRYHCGTEQRSDVCMLDSGLESVYCKYQLLLAVLQCVSRLFRIDTVLYTHCRLKAFSCTNISWEDSEDEAEN